MLVHCLLKSRLKLNKPEKRLEKHGKMHEMGKKENEEKHY